MRAAQAHTQTHTHDTHTTHTPEDTHACNDSLGLDAACTKSDILHFPGEMQARGWSVQYPGGAKEQGAPSTHAFQGAVHFM